jgi:hypothetical protein
MPDQSRMQYQSNNREVRVPACELTVSDLRKLWTLLEEKVKESADLQTKNLLKPPNFTDDQFKEFMDSQKQSIFLSVYVRGTDGKDMLFDDDSVFSEAMLPSDIKTVLFENSFNYRQKFGFDPTHRFNLLLDFHRQRVLDFSNIDKGENINLSTLNISGKNNTWVNGVEKGVLDFLRDKHRKRTWLHKTSTFNLYVWLISVPTTFWVLYRLDPALRTLNMSNILLTAFYVYTSIIILLGCRLIFNYIRWTFPFLEYACTSDRPRIHRGWHLTIILGIAAALIYDILKKLLYP